MPYALLITCEHAGNLIPDKYKNLFIIQEEVLASHEGWDPGAWEVATYLGEQLNTPPFGCHTSRLLIEANRSIHHHQLFSRFTSSLNQKEKQELINGIYLPYRNSVEQKIAELAKPILHLSIHTFTPVLHNQERKVEIGLLFDPDRKSEALFCKVIQEELRRHQPNYDVQYNKPYLGTDDGFTTHLRSLYTNDQYIGIEIEISQKFLPELKNIKECLLFSIKRTLTR